MGTKFGNIHVVRKNAEEVLAALKKLVSNFRHCCKHAIRTRPITSARSSRAGLAFLTIHSIGEPWRPLGRNFPHTQHLRF